MADSEQIVKITIDDVLPKLIDRYIIAEKAFTDMHNFIRENSTNSYDFTIAVPTRLRRRYGLHPVHRHPGLAWYLLDEYFKGNITIKKDAQSEP